GGQQHGVQQKANIKAPIREHYQHQRQPNNTSPRQWDDRGIDPAQTPEVLAQAHYAPHNAPNEPTPIGEFPK
ncbi:methylcrotonoyl-CoA carboxylase, partial [Pseudomonas aeruginosa]